MDKNIKLFCDGSVNPKKKLGFGAFFILSSKDEFSLNHKIHLKKFDNTSSTKLELEILLWAFSLIDTKNKQVTVYTDCQNILNLEGRRKKLESNDFKSSSEKLLKNHDLYKKFYSIIDTISCTFVKVKGHKKSSLKNEIDFLFNLVDKASRKALREFNEKEKK